MLAHLVAAVLLVTTTTGVDLKTGCQARRRRPPQASCADLPGVDELPTELVNAAAGNSIADALGPGSRAGGLFARRARMGRGREPQWRALRRDNLQARPERGVAGSETIAKAKASTANAFSLDGAPMSTARLYPVVARSPLRRIVERSWASLGALREIATQVLHGV